MQQLVGSGNQTHNECHEGGSGSFFPSVPFHPQRLMEVESYFNLVDEGQRQEPFLSVGGPDLEHRGDLQSQTRRTQIE